MVDHTQLTRSTLQYALINTFVNKLQPIIASTLASGGPVGSARKLTGPLSASSIGLQQVK